MPALTLPPTFSNSFWSQEYRRGLETLYDKLDQGVAENLEVFNFIKARALAENDIGNALTANSPTDFKEKGFDADDGASLLLAFRALQAESVKQGEAHKITAQELVSLVADPFGQWASGHNTRIHESRKTLIDGWLKAYELAKGDVETLKQTYLNKTRRADEAEDDAKFAPGTKVSDHYTTSPKMNPTNDRGAKRTASVSERISARFKELRKNLEKLPEGDEKKPASPNSPVFSAGGESTAAEDEPSFIPSKDKGKGKEIDPLLRSESPAPLSPPGGNTALPEAEKTRPTLIVPKPGSPLPRPPVVLAGLALPAEAVSQLLTRAAAELPLRPVRFPILGEYQECFSGEEFVTWLKDNVEGFGGSLDRAEDAAEDLTERDDVLRRIGELGNRFENSKDAYFQFRPKAFEYHTSEEPVEAVTSPVTENIMRRTTNLVSIVQKAVANTAATNSEPFYLRARREAEEADSIYRVAVRKLDRQRLGLEEKIEETLKLLQKWELERLRAVKTVLLQYHGVISNLPKAFNSSLERSTVAISSYQAENDLIALMERYRTGPFRPTPHIYESITHDKPDIVFGIDLRTWAGEGGWNAVRANDEQKEIEKQDIVPRIVTDLLKGLEEAYKKLDDGERRKTWIYEVPLPAVHHLREAINKLPANVPIPADLLAKYDAPVLASTLKLWILELDPPLGLWEGWEDIRKLYPAIGSAGADEAPEQEKLDDLQSALVKLPKIHLLVLDAIVGHLRNLIDTTKTEESNEVYITKLAISIGRAVLRPKHETQLSIQARHPTLLFVDLVSHYASIIPKAISRKKRESMDRVLPTRKRTKMVDQRLSRSKITYEVDPRQLLAAQHAAHNPPSRSTSPAPGTERRRSVQPTSPPAVPPTASAQEEPKDIHAPVPVLPTSPPAAEPVASTPPAPAPAPASAPAAPAPAPAETYVPPNRPVFAEEATDKYVPPPMPTFAEPSSEFETPTKNVVVLPPTPVQPQSPTGSDTPSPSPTKANEDRPLVAKSSLSRSGSSDVSRLRAGPRGARAPARGAASGLGSPTTSSRSPRASPSPTTSSPSPRASPSPTSSRPLSHSRGASSASLTAEQAAQYAPKKHVGKGSAALFSRRTVASDAEDNILDK
ncbi:hypothetical protein M422DRAFT_23852 [Sphaerobolus stellatus SS14]|nr:hypothetical protein M422DRAFT_23852 [Sphaerobolus stellatus SS14]